MRKILSVFLCVMMLLSVLALGVNAVEGTAVKTAADFAGMTADGKYYLDADINVDATYATAFTGTFDGNGHTVTVSVPMFAEFNGTAKNLTIKGAVDTSATAGHTGAFANTVNGSATFEKIVNEASVKGYLTEIDKTYRAGTGGIVGLILKGAVVFTGCVNKGEIIGHAAGGIVGSYDDKDKTYTTDYAATFVDCENSGHVSASDSTKVNNNGAAGGILGIANKVGYLTFKNCKNSGKIEADKACGGPAGGITAYIYTALKADGNELASFIDCENSGEVITADSQAGGITGWSRIRAEFTNCVNSGYIHSGTNGSDINNGYCAGIACRVSSDKGAVTTKFTNCLNSGNVNSGRDQTGGIVAYHNGGSIDFVNCTNTGKISNETNQTGKAGKAGGIFGSHGENSEATVANPAIFTFTGCTNSGEIHPGTDASKDNFTGGMFGYIWADDEADTQYAKLEKCVNTGTVYCQRIASQIGGYTNSPTTVIKDCVGNGKIVLVEGGQFPTFVGMSSAIAANYAMSGNKIVKDDGTQYYTYSKNDDNSASVIELKDADPAKLAVVEAADAQAAIAALGAIGYQAPQASDPGTVTPVVTGDGIVWVALVAALSVLGMGIALKTGKN